MDEIMNVDVFEHCLNIIFEDVEKEHYEQLFRIICRKPIDEDDKEWYKLISYCSDKTRYKSYLKKALKLKAERSIQDKGRIMKT